MSMILRVQKVRLHEEIDGQDKVFQPGEIFMHPDDERAKELLAVTPATVKKPNDADYLEYVKFALKLAVDVPDFVAERIAQIEQRKGGGKGKGAPKPKTAAPAKGAAGGAKSAEADGDGEEDK